MKIREPKGIITSESPDIHWGFLDIRNKVVLDLGCGINSEFTPTPVYFLQERKASKVIGVDGNPQSYEWFKQNYNVQHFIPHMDMVDRHEKFIMYMDYYKPQVMKIDVEGSEIMMNAIEYKHFDGIDEIAVEYHNLSCLLSIEHIFENNDYTINYYKFDHIDIDYQGVIHGIKNKI
jgi:hypothetical protein